MRNIALVLFLFCLPFLAEAQLNTVWEATKKQSNDEHIEAALEATNGTIFSVGYTESYPGNKRDGYFEIIDTRSGQILRSKNIGGRNDEAFQSIIQTNAGNFVLAGYTETETKGKKDAWIVCVDENGNFLWEEKIGTTGNDAFAAIAYDARRNLISAFGYRNDRKQEDIWGAQWELTATGPQLLTDQLSFGRNLYQGVKGIVTSDNGEILITGNHSKPKGRIFLLQLNADGQQQWSRSYGQGNEVVESIHLTSAGNYMLAGSTITRSEGENMYAIMINKYGDELWNEDYGGKDHDAALTVTEALDGGFYLVGRTLSHKPNARSEKIYLVKTSKGGDREYEKNYGGNQDDIGRVVLQLRNSYVFWGADSESDGAQKKDIIYRALQAEVDQMPDLRQMKGSVQFISIGENIKLHAPDEVLRPNDRTYFSVTLINESKITLPNVSVRVGNNGAKGIQPWSTNYVGQMQAGERKVINVPVSVDGAPDPGSHDFPLTVMAGTVSLENSKVTLESKVAKPAQLDLYDYQATLVQTTRGTNASAVKLSMTFVNKGDLTSQSISLQPDLQNGLQALPGQSTLNLGKLPASGTRKASFTFQASAEYLKYRRDATIAFNVMSNGQLTGSPIRVTIDNLENPTASSGLGNKPIVLWADPEPRTDGPNRFQTSDPNAKIRVLIANKRGLKTQDIKVYQNKTVVETNKNFAEEELNVTGDGLEQTSYSRKIQLKEGINEIYVQVGEGQSEKFIFEYLPRSRNLHVVSIGPNHPDLKYTSQDAKDFAKAFQQQEGKLFNQVFVTELTTPEKTTQLEIIKAMVDLENKFRNQEILPNDVVMVFISSHGIIGTGDRYKIIPSGFDPAYGDRFTIDYKDDILGPLGNIKCKKMVLIDACHSGAASAKGPFKDKRRSEMIFRLNAQSPGLSSITSSQSSEMSYEDSAWNNGAFTEAILEAFDNTPVRAADGTTFQASVDDDFLTLGELYRFVRRRVSGLVKTYKPNAPTSQTPDLIKGAEALDEDLPLFEITKN
ncbi:MAG: caspase family protein [Bacteroidota bacterium]